MTVQVVSQRKGKADTIAAPVNLITVATGNDALPAALSPTGWAILAIMIVTAVALGVTARLRTLAYGLPIAWGLLGAFVAEQVRNPVLAYAALTAVVAILVGTVVLTVRRPASVRRTAT
jgi:hypothetical protein